MARPTDSSIPRAALVLGAAALLAAASSGRAAVGIRNTKHDLSRSSTVASGIKAVTDDEICKFCHTPHQAASTQLVWNRPQSSLAYTWGYDEYGTPISTTINGTPLPSSIRSGSKLCLSCHDGSIALGAVRNSGGGAGTPISIQSVAGVGVGGVLDGYGVVAPGGNLSGSHPVSIPYAGEVQYNNIDSALLGKANNQPGTYWRVRISAAGCDNATGICTEAAGEDLAGSRIQLYPNVPGGNSNFGIECDTCHEPHNKYGLGLFMRVEAQTSDALCRSCHLK